MDFICRLCLERDENFSNIFTYSFTSDITPTLLFYNIFGIRILESDPYTTFICSQCINIVETILQYRKRFLQNQTQLNSFVESSSIVSKENNQILYISHISRLGGSNESEKDDISKQNMDDGGLKDEDKQSEFVKLPLISFDKRIPYVLAEKNEFLEDYEKIGEYTYKKIIKSKHNIINDCNLKKEEKQTEFVKLPLISLNKCIPYVSVEKNEFLNSYERIDKYTYKKIENVETHKLKEKIQNVISSNLKTNLDSNKIRFLKEYYYRMKTSAIRELIKERAGENSRKKTNEFANCHLNTNCQFNDLMFIGETELHVCLYCSKIFSHNFSLQTHIDTFHDQNKIKRNCNTSLKCNNTEDLNKLNDSLEKSIDANPSDVHTSLMNSKNLYSTTKSTKHIATKHFVDTVCFTQPEIDAYNENPTLNEHNYSSKLFLKEGKKRRRKNKNNPKCDLLDTLGKRKKYLNVSEDKNNLMPKLKPQIKGKRKKYLNVSEDKNNLMPKLKPQIKGGQEVAVSIVQNCNLFQDPPPLRAFLLSSEIENGKSNL